jgi:hypothetical protein
MGPWTLVRYENAYRLHLSTVLAKTTRMHFLHSKPQPPILLPILAPPMRQNSRHLLYIMRFLLLPVDSDICGIYECRPSAARCVPMSPTRPCPRLSVARCANTLELDVFDVSVSMHITKLH